MVSECVRPKVRFNLRLFFSSDRCTRGCEADEAFHEADNTVSDAVHHNGSFSCWR